MIHPEPARLIGFFAHGAPVCVIARRGPSHYTRLILWQTDEDVFTPKQWFRGTVDHATMSKNGRYMAIGIMGVCQAMVVCKPPYISGIERWEGGLCMKTLAFLPGNTLTVPEFAKPKHSPTVRAPFRRIPDYQNCNRDHDWTIDATRGPASGIDHRGRKVTFEAGCVFVGEGEDRTLLLDTNPMKFELIKAPEWARRW